MSNKSNESTKNWGNGLESIVDFSKNVVPGFYFVAVLLGAAFSWAKYSRAGINIFEYATVFDFLVMPLRNKLCIFFATVPFISVATSILYDKKASKIAAKNPKSNWARQFDSKFVSACRSIPGKILIFVLYLFVVARIYGALLGYNVRFDPIIKIEFNDNTTLRGFKFGQIEKYIFLYTGNEQVVVPIDNEIKTIKLGELAHPFDVEEFQEESIHWLNKEANTIERWITKFMIFMSK